MLEITNMSFLLVFESDEAWQSRRSASFRTLD
jgi:hypothetical protein